MRNAWTPTRGRAGRVVAQVTRRLLAVLVLGAVCAVSTRAAAAAEGDWETGKTYPLRLTGNNRAVKLSVANASFAQRYGETAAAPGRRLLILNTRWANLIPLTLIEEKQVPTEYKVPNLADHLYLVVDGRVAARLAPNAADLPGHVPVRDFKLEKVGDILAGNVVFDVAAADGAESLELRFYDYAHGHIVVPLKTPSTPLAAPKPLSPPLKNEVVEVAAYGLERLPEVAGRKAPAGMTFVAVDLRARSLFTTEADATAFDPKAKPGAKTQLGYVADWKESRRYLQLVADGEYAYMPEAQGTTLAEEPRFLPDVMTGDTVVFLAPESAKSLELRCDFPNAKASTGGAVFRPKGLTLALEGKRPAMTQRQAITFVDDDVYRISVVGQQQADTFAGEKAAGKFLVLDVTVANSGSRNGEFFQTKEQLKYANASGQQAELSAVTFQGPRRPPELLWIPPGERRTFQAVFDITADEKTPRLAFRGVSKAEVLNLKPLEAIAVASAPDPAPGVRPNADARPNTAPPPAAPAKQPAKEPMRVAANAGQPVKPAATTKPPSGSTTPPARTVPSANPALKPAKEAKPTRVAAKQPHEPKGLAGVGLTAEQVNTAIDRGAAALWSQHAAEMKKRGNVFGSNLGYDVLIALSLVHADYHKKSPAFDAELRGMLSRADPSDLGTYGAGCYIMLIEAYGDGYYMPKLRHALRCLVENQGVEGSWGYYTRVPDELLRDPAAERVLQIRGGLPLEGEGSLGTPLKRITPYTKDDDGDNSTSQYALLGMWSATKAKAPVEPEQWTRALAAYRERQCKDGGWNYTTPSYSYGSMTCAGVCAIALARHHLGEAAPAEDEAVERGLAWLANHFTVAKHPEGSDGHLYYYLYSLERVGRILDTEFIGPHEWYPIGAKWLIDNQKADGLWGGGNHENEPVATPFALMFLTRATTTLNPEHRRGGDGKLRTDVAVAPGHKVYVILDCSGSMLPEMGGKQKFEAAREAVAALVKELPDNAEVALRAYGHRKNARQEGADLDTELVVPMGKLNRPAFMAKLNALKPRGKTPLALSLREAIKDVGNAANDPEKPVTLVLLTDGGEDTRPRQDPLAAADEAGKLKGLNFQIVGFDINRSDWDEQLRGMAGRGGGQYLPAAESKALARDLRSAVFRVPDTFLVTTAKGQPVMRAGFGTTKVLPEGKYRFATTFAGKQYTQEFWINTDSTTAVVFDASKQATDKSGQAVAERGNARPRRPAAAPDEESAADAAPEAEAEAEADAVPARPRPRRAPANTAPAAKKRFCTECGKPVTAGAKFCPSCGAKVTG